MKKRKYKIRYGYRLSHESFEQALDWYADMDSFYKSLKKVKEGIKEDMELGIIDIKSKPIIFKIVMEDC